MGGCKRRVTCPCFCGRRRGGECLLGGSCDWPAPVAAERVRDERPSEPSHCIAVRSEGSFTGARGEWHSYRGLRMPLCADRCGSYQTHLSLCPLFPSNFHPPFACVSVLSLMTLRERQNPAKVPCRTSRASRSGLGCATCVKLSLVTGIAVADAALLVFSSLHHLCFPSSLTAAQERRCFNFNVHRALKSPHGSRPA